MVHKTIPIPKGPHNKTKCKESLDNLKGQSPNSQRATAKPVSKWCASWLPCHSTKVYKPLHLFVSLTQKINKSI